MKKYVVLTIIGVGLFIAGRYSRPAEVHEVIKTVKDVTTDMNKERNNHTVVTIEKKPDGTEVKRIESDTQTTNHTTSHENTVTTSDKTTKSNQTQWSVGLYKDSQAYMLAVDRRLLGNVFVGVYERQSTPSFDMVTNKPQVGIGIRSEF